MAIVIAKDSAILDINFNALRVGDDVQTLTGN
jgi:hypothetical protein